MNDTENVSPQDPAEPPSNGPPGSAAPPATWPAAPVRVILEPAHRSRRRLLSALGWIGFLVATLMLMTQWSARSDYFNTSQGIRERFHSGVKTGADKVAIIAVRGVLLHGDGFPKQQIDRIREDKDVKAVVVRVDSPGGTVSASDYIHHHLKRLQQERGIPLVVSMGSVAASGGYYVSMAVGDQEKAIFAEPTTTTGSIGVVVPHYDLSGLLARFDVQDDSIASHPRKHLLSMTRPFSEEDEKLIEQYVNDLFARFKSIVKSGRPDLRRANEGDALRDPATGQNLATGEIFPAPRALQHGLIDEIGFVEDAVARAIELAGLDANNVRVVEYQPPLSLLSFAGMGRARGEQNPLRTILDMSAPRAYYMATTIPPLAATSREAYGVGGE